MTDIDIESEEGAQQKADQAQSNAESFAVSEVESHRQNETHDTAQPPQSHGNGAHDRQFVDEEEAAVAAPVQSVDGRVGDVTLDTTDLTFGLYPLELTASERDELYSDFEKFARSFAVMNTIVLFDTVVDEVAASETAMDAVAASETAMDAVAASETAMDAVAASQTAMDEVAASETAMDAVVASELALDAVATSQTAMDVVAASEAAMDVVAASEAAMDVVAASETAMDEVAASETAMGTVAASETAMFAVGESAVGSSLLPTTSFTDVVYTDNRNFVPLLYELSGATGANEIKQGEDVGADGFLFIDTDDAEDGDDVQATWTIDASLLDEMRFEAEWEETDSNTTDTFYEIILDGDVIFTSPSANTGHGREDRVIDLSNEAGVVDVTFEVQPFNPFNGGALTLYDNRNTRV